MATTIAEDMKRLTEDMLTANDTRLKSVSSLMARTQETLKGFRADRNRMATSQARDLAGFTGELSKQVSALRHKAQRMVTEFNDAGRQMGKEQSDRLAGFVQGLAEDVTGMLKRFGKERGHVSKNLGEQLDREIADVKAAVEGILQDTASFMNEQHSGMVKARQAWRDMSMAIRRARMTGVAASPAGVGHKTHAAKPAAPKSRARKTR